MSQSSALPTYSAIYAFGDSLSDAGNLSISTKAAGAQEPVSPPYFTQQYGTSTGTVFSNGPTWVQNVSIALGLGTLAPSLTGGTDFAYGGAETGLTPQNTTDPKIQAISLPAQLTQFQKQVTTPAANALYTLSIGSNDLLDILGTPGLSADQQATDVNDAVANEISFVKSLVSDGAKNLLVLDIPDLGKTPDVMLGLANGSNTPSAALDAEASQLASSYNSALTSQLAALASASAVNVHVVDAYGLIDSAVANPASYGLTNVTSRVWTGNYTDSTSGTLAATTPAAQDQYLFWDSLHPTETGHQAIADAAEQQLSGAPVLAVTDTTTGQPVTATGQPYTGPVAGVQQEYVSISTDNLNISASTPNWFIYSASTLGSISASSGTNVLDGTGSDFFTGGSGIDNFYVDYENQAASIWSTITNFHAGDTATIWGLTADEFPKISWQIGQGAAGYTGLTVHVPSPGGSSAALTFAGLTALSLSDGQLGIGSGESGGVAYFTIHANA
nr:SGNH/GDSL hydrolase family protein [uncultured Rhodopila sp.]